MLPTAGLKAKAISVLQEVAKNYVYETTYGQVRIIRKGGLGFLTRFVSNSDPEEALLSGLDFRGKTIFDIGGYIGLMTMFFAARAKPSGQVIVFEPNRENCVQLQEHLLLNRVDNARLFRMALGEKKEACRLVVRQNSSATGSLDERIQSQIVKERRFKEWLVDVDTLDGAILTHRLPYPDFIKMDVEGVEYGVLLGASKTVHACAPDLEIEIHGADQVSKVENICRIVQLLQSWRYVIWHVESQQRITPENYQAARQGHIYCRRAGWND